MVEHTISFPCLSAFLSLSKTCLRVLVERSSPAIWIWVLQSRSTKLLYPGRLFVKEPPHCGANFVLRRAIPIVTQLLFKEKSTTTQMGSVDGEMKLNNRLTALVVDDDMMIRKLHTMRLKSAGMDVVEAENGKVAVDISRSGKVFDLILMDKEMPIMNGPQATQLLREMGVMSMIVGITAESEEKEIQIFKDAGLNICYEKPLTKEKLKAILENINNH